HQHSEAGHQQPSPRLCRESGAAPFGAVDEGAAEGPEGQPREVLRRRHRRDEMFDRASETGFVVVTADSDFGILLAMRRTTSPPVVHLRHVAELEADAHVALLVANLADRLLGATPTLDALRGATEGNREHSR